MFSVDIPNGQDINCGWNFNNYNKYEWIELNQFKNKERSC